MAPSSRGSPTIGPNVTRVPFRHASSIGPDGRSDVAAGPPAGCGRKVSRGSARHALAKRCGTMPIGLSALFERELAPVAQWIRAADFGLSRQMRCSTEFGGASVEPRVICSLRALAARAKSPTGLTGSGAGRGARPANRTALPDLIGPGQNGAIATSRWPQPGPATREPSSAQRSHSSDLSVTQAGRAAPDRSGTAASSRCPRARRCDSARRTGPRCRTSP
jgi:hypothetical protein